MPQLLSRLDLLKERGSRSVLAEPSAEFLGDLLDKFAPLARGINESDAAIDEWIKDIAPRLERRDGPLLQTRASVV